MREKLDKWLMRDGKTLRVDKTMEKKKTNNFFKVILFTYFIHCFYFLFLDNLVHF